MSQGKFAGPDEWARLRDTITALYVSENKPLKDVIRIMADKHDFRATERMYKRRFKQWGVHKYIKDSQIAELLQQRAAANSGAVDTVVKRGSNVNVSQKRMRTFLQRQGSHAAAPSVTTLSVPEQFQLPQECMQIIQDYISSGFEKGLWQTTPEGSIVSDRTTVDWCDSIVTAAMILRRDSKKGFKVLQLCLDQYRQIMSAGEHPLLFFHTYSALLNVPHDCPGLIVSVAKHLYQLADITYGPAHPFVAALKRLYQLACVDIKWFGQQIYEVYREAFGRYLDPTSSFMVEVTCGMVATLIWVDPKLLKSSADRVSELRDQVVANPKGASSSSLIPLSQQIAWTQFRSGDWEQGLRSAQTMLDQLKPEDNWLYRERVENLWRSVVGCARGLGRHEEAVEAFRNTIEFCRTNFGPTHDRTVLNLVMWRDYLRDIGDDAGAEAAQLTSESIMKKVSIEQQEKEARQRPFTI